MQSHVSKGKKLWQGAVYLSVAAIVIKVLSAIYRIPYQNIAGDVGFYVYQQIYPIYGVAITLSTYGFPVIISKLISEKINDRSEIIKTAFWSLLSVSSVIFAIFYFSAAWLASMMGDAQLQVPLRTISFIFFVIPFLSVLRGLFQGEEEMLPTAVSQVFEQLSRVCAILLLTYFFIDNGHGPYGAGTGAAFGSIFGGFVGFLVLLYFYQKQRGTAKQLHINKRSLVIVKTILLSGLMICFSNLLLIIFQIVDSLTVLRGLVESGVQIESAKVMKGIFDRGQPLIQMGTVITTSFSLVVVPLIAKVQSEGRQDLIQKYSSLAFKISFLVGAAASVGLAVIIEPTNVMLFKDNTDSLVLAVMGAVICFSSIFLTTSAILHGLNKVVVTVVHVCLGFLVKGLFNLILIPKIGTLGAAIATVIACVVCACLNIYALQKLNALPKVSLAKGIKFVISLIVMAVATFLWKNASYFLLAEAANSRLGNTCIAISSVAVGTIVFFIVITLAKLISEEELAYLPKVSKLAAFMQLKKSK